MHSRKPPVKTIVVQGRRAVDRRTSPGPRTGSEDPAAIPEANCFAERFVGTARAELTDRIPIFGERQQRTVLAAYSTTTTAGGHIERCDFSRHAPIIPPPTLHAGGSDADRCWED
jgi:hypothetical protein